MKESVSHLIEAFKEIEAFKDFSNLINTAKDEHQEQVFIFVSVDIVNSTRFKKEYSEWADYFADIFDIIKVEFRKNNDLRLWKYVGDEVLFFKELTSTEDMLKILSEVSRKMNRCKIIMDENIKITSNNVYLKGAIWIAAVKDFENKDSKLKNIIPRLPESAIDFIGVNIDEGFRIARYTSQGKFILDAKLAYLIYKNKIKVDLLCDYNVSERIKIVSYKKLKGIWGERLYPIIWYHKNWNRRDEMFLYDEYDTNEVVQELKDKQYQTENIAIIEKIVAEVGIIEEIKHIERIIKEKEDNVHNSTTHYLPYEDTVELHCAVICVNPKNKKALIFKRSDKKERFPNMWEFGCAKAKKTNSLEEQIQKEYKDDFGLNIELIKENNNPIPIATYEIECGSGELHKGIILLAEIKGHAETINLNPSKHIDFKWLDEEEIDSFAEDTVEGLKENCKKAIRIYKDFKKGK